LTMRKPDVSDCSDLDRTTVLVRVANRAPPAESLLSPGGAARLPAARCSVWESAPAGRSASEGLPSPSQTGLGSSETRPLFLTGAFTQLA
jgi:hypothetical protein